MRWIVAAVAILAAIVVGITFGAKWVLAPLLGYVIYRVSTSMLRGMAAGSAYGEAPSEPEPVLDRPERTLYWCEQCGAEMLLVVRGTAHPPRHCGERMHERVEVLRDQTP